MSREVQAALGTTCPDGGSFYVCDDKPSKFLGCCTVDACKTDDGLCPDDKLTFASYDMFSHNNIAPQSCQSDKPEVQWWTCGALDEPFMGCCSVNACAKGCPSDNLYPAKLSDDEDDAAIFLPEDDGGSDSDSSGSGGGLSKGAIGGIAAGAVIAAIIIGALIWFFLRRRKGKQSSADSYEPYAGQPVPESNPQSPQMQKDNFSTYSPYPSSYAPTPNPAHAINAPTSPAPHWQAASHQSQQGMSSSPYNGSEISPDPSQGQFQDGVKSPYHSGYNNNGNSFIQELPGSTEYHGAGDQVPNMNVSEMSYQGGRTGRESEVSGMSGWNQQQQHVAEMEAPEQSAADKK